MMIDVVMLTKNSNKPYFRRVLSAIKRNVPVHHFVVVDAYSMDGTVETIKEFFGDKVIVVRSNATLGKARYIGMKLVDTEWFAFIDSDCEILDSWFNVAKIFMRHPKIYGIQGVFIGKEPASSSDATRRLSVVKPVESVDKKLVIRFGFYIFSGADSGHVLLRSGVIRFLDPRVMSRLDCGEDFYIAHQIVKHGFYYIRVADMRAIHHRNRVTYEILKTFKRSMGGNGLLLEIPPHIMLGYSLVRFAASIIKLRPLEALPHLCSLLTLPIAYTKIKALR